MAKLVELLEKIIGGGTPSKNENKYWNGNIPWASVKDIGENQVYLSYTQDSITKEGLAKSSSNLIPKGNVIIPTRMGLGRCVINKIDTAINQDLKALIPKKDKLNNKYLLYWLKFNAALIESMGSGTTVKGIRLEQLTELELNDIDIKIQQKIARILSNYDDLIENNNRRIKILEEMARKIYKEWFVDFKFPGHETTTFKDSPLGKIPNDWEVKKVVELSTLSKGKSYKSSELVDKKDGLPFLNLKCVERDGGFKREGLKWFCGKYNDNHVVLPEDIIMAVTDMTQERKLVARPARIPHNWYKKYIMSMDLVKLVANNDINKTYLYSLLKYSNFSDEVKNHANGVNVLHLNPQNIEQFELVVASEPLRNNFGEFAKRIFNQIDVLYLKNEDLKQTRDILLPRLISGEINVENMEVL